MGMSTSSTYHLRDIQEVNLVSFVDTVLGIFRSGMVYSFVIHCIALHKALFCTSDFTVVESDDGTLKGVKSKCVKFLTLLS